MSRAIRFVVVMTCIAVVIGAGLNGAAWAEKLKSGVQAPAANGLDTSLQAKRRPNGTVATTPTCIQADKPGKFTIGSIAQWILNNVPAGSVYEACVVKPIDMPAKAPGVVLTWPIKLFLHNGTLQGVPHQICFPVPPGSTGSAYYWDGKAWVKTEAMKNGQACVTIPKTAPAPTFIVLVR